MRGNTWGIPACSYPHRYEHSKSTVSTSYFQTVCLCCPQFTRMEFDSMAKKERTHFILVWVLAHLRRRVRLFSLFKLCEWIWTCLDNISDLRSDHWAQNPKLIFSLLCLQFFSKGLIFVKYVYSLLVLWAYACWWLFQVLGLEVPTKKKRFY